VGDAELFAGILPAALAAQPLAVDEVGAGEVGGHPATLELLNGLAVLFLGSGLGCRPDRRRPDPDSVGVATRSIKTVRHR
jgi:hypothetical protein